MGAIHGRNSGNDSNENSISYGGGKEDKQAIKEEVKRIMLAGANLSSPDAKIAYSDFETLKLIGQGSFGKVYQVRHRVTGDIFAMKELKKSKIVASKQVPYMKSERHLLQKVDHPFIVSLKYAFQSEKKLFLVLEFFNGGELYYHLQKETKFSEERARFYAAQIVLALEYLHSKRIIYRDLKPENVVLDGNGYIRITDLGLSKEFPQAAENKSFSPSSSSPGKRRRHYRTNTFCGTPQYMAPEIIQSDPYGFEVDWWALGVLLYEMIVGKGPFQDNEQRDSIYDRILDAPLHIPNNVSASASDLLKKLLDKDPVTRLGSYDAAEVKSHPFFSGLDWDLLLHKKIQPEFVPDVVGKTDVKFISEELLGQVVDSATSMEPSQATKKLQEINFSNFSFQRDAITSGIGGNGIRSAAPKSYSHDSAGLLSLTITPKAKRLSH